MDDHKTRMLEISLKGLACCYSRLFEVLRSDSILKNSSSKRKAFDPSQSSFLGCRLNTLCKLFLLFSGVSNASPFLTISGRLINSSKKRKFQLFPISGTLNS